MLNASTQYQKHLQPWLVKFTSASLPLGHEEGLCEAAYLTMANNAEIAVPQWKLIVTAKKPWLAVKRFDLSPQGGKVHMHSACGLLNVDYRAPALDYEDLIKASQMLCKSPAVAQQQFTRALFNLFSLNQDDHSKNWAFLMDDVGGWRLSPFYDVTYSPTPYNEHSTSFIGYGKNPPLKAIQKLAEHANYSSWSQARTVIEEIIESIQQWDSIAKGLGINKKTRSKINQQLNKVRIENRDLF